jgi:hypothetical protein
VIAARELYACLKKPTDVLKRHAGIRISKQARIDMGGCERTVRPNAKVAQNRWKGHNWSDPDFAEFAQE